jgi:dipeptidyl aminopeptidase/acylaminoacyl peptidase
MKHILLAFIFSASTSLVFGQSSSLTIKQIMQGEQFVGSLPSSVYWGEHGEYIYFNWNPEGAMNDSLYRASTTDLTPKKVEWALRQTLPARRGTYNKDKSLKLYARDGDLFIYNLTKRSEQQITNTLGRESNPTFSFDEQQVHYQSGDNLFSWDIQSGIITQLTNFNKRGDSPEKKVSAQDAWLEAEEMELIGVLQERKAKNDKRDEIREAHRSSRPKKIVLGTKNVSNITLSADGNYITYGISTPAKNSINTKVPDYVTESAYTANKNARAKVGTPQSGADVGIYDIKNDTVYQVSVKDLPGLDWQPDFMEKRKGERPVFVQAPMWSPDGSLAVVIVRSKDNKDRWITLLDLATGTLKTLDHQHDDAWVAGPGVGWSRWDRTLGWVDDNQTIWFQSEATGYSHLYSLNITSGKKKALTKGNFEVYSPRLSADKKHWYLEANKEDTGIRQFYQMEVSGGKMTALTSGPGRFDGFLSPNEDKVALLHSTANMPTELYLQANTAGAEAKKITSSTTQEFQSYDWRTPEFITFKAEDGAEVHARLYAPESGKKSGAAVVFVHGAGYLQNAHQWWSSYYREYMFHNFLVDNGYTVLDIDYRGSAGYGRDWRTGIYRFMGGLDLSDNVDGAKFLVDEHGIDAKRIGLYGGSYGGFITLMAMFNEPETFAAGGALRSVTDWAHYNHGYTSNILNVPVDDPESYRKSSPIYFAEGLEGALLICHGMIDTNVQFQDVVRLSQRLIELEKTNWEMAVYPLESHGFVEPSSWNDEYSRIFKLFEDNIK